MRALELKTKGGPGRCYAPLKDAERKNTALEEKRTSHLVSHMASLSLLVEFQQRPNVKYAEDVTPRRFPIPDSSTFLRKPFPCFFSCTNSCLLAAKQT